MNSAIRITEHKIFLTIRNLNEPIRGYTEITFESTTDAIPRVLFLNARQMTIEAVRYGDTEASYNYVDTHKALEMSTGPIVRDASHFSRVCQDVLNSPELIIKTPKELPATVRIDFTVNANSSALAHYNGILYTNNILDGPSAWFPCIDGLGQRSHFQLDITFPNSLILAGPGKPTVLSSDQSNQIDTIRYTFPYPLHPCDLGFAIGDFKSNQLSQNVNVNFLFKEDEESFMHTMVPFIELLQEVSESFVPDETLLESYNIVYIPELQEIHSFPGLIFYPSSYIVPDGNAAVWVQIVPRIYEMCIAQFIKFLFPVSAPQDEWIIEGLIRYFTDYFLGFRYQISFAEERRWNDMNFLLKEDIHPSVVLSAIDPATGTAFRDEYLRIKAKLLINMIATSMSEPILLLIRQLFKTAQEQLIGITDKFYTIVSKFCSLINPKAFKHQWLNSNGMPIFTFNFTADPRNRQMRFVLYQSPSTKTTNIKFFTGYLVVQLRDLEQPHEFKFAVESQILQQQMKYYAHKPKRRSTMMTFVNGMQEKINIYSGVMWVCIDPSHSWLMRVYPRLPEFMLHYMLKLVRNVYTQHETIAALDEWKNTDETQNRLKDFLNNEACFYGVRGHAAKTLALFANDDLQSMHKVIQISWYKDHFYTKGDHSKPMSHNFQDLSKHFVQLDVIKSLSVIRTSTDYTPPDVVQLLKEIMEQSDNTGNQYTDDNFQAEVSLALGRLNPEIGLDEIEQILAERVRGTQLARGFCDTLLSAMYIALTANLLKQQGGPYLSREFEGYQTIISKMRTIIFSDSPFLQAKGEIFRCLLFMSLIGINITYSQLISDIKKLCITGKKMVAAQCLRELYRFVLNTLPFGARDRFEGQLLCFPENVTKKIVIDLITKSEDALDIAETLWSILTIDAKYHSILRSEALRAYTTLYGQGTPAPFLDRNVQAPVELVTSTLKTQIRVDTKTKRHK